MVFERAFQGVIFLVLVMVVQVGGEGSLAHALSQCQSSSFQVPGIDADTDLMSVRNSPEILVWKTKPSHPFEPRRAQKIFVYHNHVIKI